MKYKEQYINAIIKEMELRKGYLDREEIETIYFGGGTPSRLTASDFGMIFEAIERNFKISDNAEITLEANPDDMRDEYLKELRQFPFNRVSMGVQSFHPDDLKFLNRRHDREQAIRAVDICRENGISNISIDLIYGLPNQTIEKWERNLDEALALNVPHISAYHLIYEAGTPLYKLMEAGKVKQIDEEISLNLFSTLISRLKESGYIHYEISNFAKDGFYSRHNSSYWNGIKYLGLGPSAHSFNGIEREWNIASLPIYIRCIDEGNPSIESEELDLNTRYNDFIITGMRTMWGISLDEIERLFGSRLRNYCKEQATPHINSGKIHFEGERLKLSESGIFVSDGIMSDMLWV